MSTPATARSLDHERAVMLTLKKLEDLRPLLDDLTIHPLSYHAFKGTKVDQWFESKKEGKDFLVITGTIHYQRARIWLNGLGPNMAFSVVHGVKDSKYSWRLVRRQPGLDGPPRSQTAKTLAVKDELPPPPRIEVRTNPVRERFTAARWDNPIKRQHATRLYTAYSQLESTDAGDPNGEKVFLASDSDQVQEIFDRWRFVNCFIVERDGQVADRIAERLRKLGLGNRVDEILFRGNLLDYIKGRRDRGVRAITLLDFDGCAAVNNTEFGDVAWCLPYVMHPSAPCVVRFVGCVNHQNIGLRGREMAPGQFAQDLTTYLKQAFNLTDRSVYLNATETFAYVNGHSKMEQAVFAFL